MATNFELLQAKLESDPAFAARLIELESAEEAQSFLKAEGMDFTMEELSSFAEAVNKYGENDGELSDEALEGVAGGSVSLATVAAVATIASVTDDMTGGHARRNITSGVRSVARRIFRGW